MNKKIVKLLKKIYKIGLKDPELNKEIFPISISEFQGEFIALFIKKNKPMSIIECGFGYGLSSLWLNSTEHKIKKHYIIDPYFKSLSFNFLSPYKLIIEQSNVDFIDKKTSQQFLASFKGKVDLIFLDAEELFDSFITDMHFSTKIIKVGGHIIVRNVWNPSVRKGLMFFIKNLSYSLVQFTKFEQFFIKKMGFLGELYLRFKLRKIDLCVLKLNSEKFREWDDFVGF